MNTDPILFLNALAKYGEDLSYLFRHWSTCSRVVTREKLSIKEMDNETAYQLAKYEMAIDKFDSVFRTLIAERDEMEEAVRQLIAKKEEALNNV